MSDVVIRVENLSKHYRLGQISGGTLREDLHSWWAGVRGKEDPWLKVGAKPNAGSGEHWALNDVSFDVRQGEVLGIIGRNGAGKSTLLKILSRTTAPTRGSVRIKGRVGSLLEVGTGFHPELSGRENIYLNGTILGMRKAEIDRKLDEIIDFSGVEKFIDTPVKRYSSGMYVRLAFAVAAHLEPEILIVDEVLAVGDMEFQEKCLGKMQDVSRHGRTVLFVSHNMMAIKNLCGQGLLLNQGSVEVGGEINKVLSAYFNEGIKHAGTRRWIEGSQPGNEIIKLESLSIIENEFDCENESNSRSIIFEIELFAIQESKGVDVELRVFNMNGVEIIHTGTSAHHIDRVIHYGKNKVFYVLPEIMFQAGTYSISISAAIPNQYFIFELKDALTFSISPQSMEGSIYPHDAWTGVLNPSVGKWFYQRG